MKITTTEAETQQEQVFSVEATESGHISISLSDPGGLTLILVTRAEAVVIAEAISETVYATPFEEGRR